MMRALMLDYQRSAQPGWVSWLLFGNGLAVAAGAVFYYVALSSELSGWERKASETVQHARRGTTAIGTEPRKQEEVERELKSANEVLRKLTVPWESLFMTLEATRGDKIALLAMEPDVRKGQVRIIAEAKTSNDMLDYLRRLGSEAAFSGVILVNHQIQQQDAERPLRFSIAVNWERKP